MRRYPPVLLWVLLGLAMSLFFGLKPVNAQTTTLIFSPDPASLLMTGTNSAVVNLEIRDAVKINAFDIILTYDAQIAVISTWAHGGFLVSPTCLITTNDPGYLHLVCTQLGKPGVYGDGTLLVLTFTGQDYGWTPLTFTFAKLSTSDSPAQSVFPAYENGTLYTYTPGVVIPTDLSGSFSLQGQNRRGNVPVTLEPGLYVGQGPLSALTDDKLEDNLEFADVAMDAYLLTTQQPRYLNLDASDNKVVALSRSALVLPPLELLAGDLDGDGEISVLDLGVVAGSFGQIGEALAGDVNFDGRVDARDLALVAGNFGQTSETAYAGWLP